MKEILKDPKTNWKYILIAALLAFLVGGGILAWIKKQEVPPAEFSEIEFPEAKFPEIDEIANWGTYRNEKWGFEVKYPPQWESIIDPCIQPVGIFGEIYSICWYAPSSYLTEVLGLELEYPPEWAYQIQIKIFPKGEHSSEEWISSGIGDPLSPYRGETVKLKQREINIGGIQTQILTPKELKYYGEPNVYEILGGSIYVPKNGIVYHFDIGIYIDEKIIEKMLSTFRFLE